MNQFRRFDVYRVSLDPIIGSEIAKTRPCVIISPDVMNDPLQTVLVAPLTSTVKGWPSRILSRFMGMKGEIALDQIRAVDKKRLGKKLGALTVKTQTELLVTLADMFAP